ncbi:MAG: TIGR04149 family rSAM-modified RiPP [Bacteroidales bacterium]|jgi:natural product precursor|nr:TIGR04149 family rSAM-modified RiPP [Bacteroidales bacterium]
MKSLKLTKLAESQLSEKEMQSVTGGNKWITSMYSATYNEKGEVVKFVCVCGCIYRDKGGSSIEDNFQANDKHGLKSF